MGSDAISDRPADRSGHRGWHLIVFRVFQEQVHIVTMNEKLLWAPAMLAVTAILTIASYYLIERPFNTLKDRLPVADTR